MVKTLYGEGSLRDVFGGRGGRKSEDRATIGWVWLLALRGRWKIVGGGSHVAMGKGWLSIRGRGRDIEVVVVKFPLSMLQWWWRT
ncbi:hypothetical protein VNO78_02880 [Psophocarpus tetragonolobus]|uniref:Uncharacterized protein n=1 Tax=Psophocarpus tetragonolobus TaxID=3891 RepID=A0AAN9SZF5_PSOTE